MITTPAKQAANEQIAALTSIGTPQAEAITMIARSMAQRLRKSSRSSPVSHPALLRRTTVKPAKGRIDEQKRSERAEIPSAAAAKKPALTHLLRLRKSLPAVVKTVNDGAKGTEKMEKSQRFEQLVSVARNNPDKLTQSTRDAVNRYLTRAGQEPVVTPAPKITFGRQITLKETAQLRQHQRDCAIAVAQTPVAGPSLKQSRMTTQQLQEHRLQQAIDAQKESAKPKPPETGVTVSWLGR